MQHIYRRTPIQNCDFDKVALHHLLLKPGPRPWTRTQKNQDPEKLGKQLDVKKKKIGRPHSILYCSNEFMQEETCEKTI